MADDGSPGGYLPPVELGTEQGRRILELLWEPSSAAPTRGPKPKITLDDVIAAGVSIAVLVLALLWVLHAWAGRRHADDQRDPRIVEARERRGF